MRAPPAGTPGGLWRHPAPYSRRSKVQRGATAASTGNWLALRFGARQHRPACGYGNGNLAQDLRRAGDADIRVWVGSCGRFPVAFRAKRALRCRLHHAAHCLLHWLSSQPPPPRNFPPPLFPLRRLSVVSRRRCCRAAMPAADVARHLWRCHRRQIAQLSPTP